jgi:hypothetical protein
LVVIGDRVSEGTYWMHSRFQRVVNFRSGDRMVSVVDRSVGPGPVNIVAEAIDFGDAGRLLIEPEALVLDGLRVSFRASEVYRSQVHLAEVDRHTLRRNLTALRDALLEVSSPRSLAFLLDPVRLEGFRPGFERTLAAHLRDAVRRISAGDLGGGVEMLSGCGFGLTPSGDDYICGMLVGLHVTSQVVGKNLAEDIRTVYCAAATDNLLSKNFLRLAYEGCVDGRLKALLAALTTGDRLATLEQARGVISMGESSGADTLTGLLMTLEKNA